MQFLSLAIYIVFCPTTKKQPYYMKDIDKDDHYMIYALSGFYNALVTFSFSPAIALLVLVVM